MLFRSIDKVATLGLDVYDALCDLFEEEEEMLDPDEEIRTRYWAPELVGVILRRNAVENGRESRTARTRRILTHCCAVSELHLQTGSGTKLKGQALVCKGSKSGGR